MNNCTTATFQILRSLKIKHTKSFVNDTVLSHPDLPSLLSIADTLDKYNIEHLAVKIDEEKLAKIPLPSIVQVKERGTTFFYTLVNLNDRTVTYYNDTNKKVVEAKEDFLKKWTGITLLVEKNEDSIEPKIKEKLFKKNLIRVLSAITLLAFGTWIVLSFNLLNSGSILSSLLIYTVLKLIGLATGVALLWYEVDKYNPTLQSFCSGGKKVNCDHVLNSKYGTLLNGNISISAVVLGYFFSTLMLLVFSGFLAEGLFLTKSLSIISAPIVLLSFISQAFIIKKWCRFCLVVQAVLLAEISIVLVNGYQWQPIPFKELILVGALFTFPVIAWIFLKELLEGKKQTNLYKRSLQKIKNNKNVFESLLLKSQKIKSSIEGLGITLKNDNAKYDVVKVCNPYCGPCAKAHPILDELYHMGLINLQIIFTTSSDEKDRRFNPVNHLMAIDAKKDKKLIQKALDDWYMAEKKEYKTFARKYPMNGELTQQIEKIEAMSTWCKNEEIMHTPTIFINGYKLTREYTINDLQEILT